MLGIILFYLNILNLDNNFDAEEHDAGRVHLGCLHLLPEALD